MKPGAIAAIAAIGEFLEAHVLPAVPAEQRSELRAARKLLDEAARELAALPAVAAAEATELRALCDAREEDRRGVLAAVEKRITELQESIRAGHAGRERLEEIYAMLGRQAALRLPFQSVFPHEPAGKLSPATARPGERNGPP